MLGSWVFNAIIQFALWPSVFKIMSSQLVRSDRSKMIFYMSFSSSGGLITTYIISALLPHWKYNFLVSAIILVLCAVVLLIYCKHLNPLMKKDYVKTSVISEADGGNKKMSTVKLFLISGFFTLLPAVLIRTMVENGTKTLSPTMLMQSYENISPSTGNLLSIFIIIAGVLGTLLIKLVLFPRIIKNEIVAYLIMMFAALPFTIVLRFVGDIPSWLVILSLSMISMSLSATHLLTQYFNMLYIPYGKNGTAAGIINAAASLGMVFQYCVFGPIADNAGSWVPVTTLWIVMVSVGIAFCAVTAIPAKKFRKKVEGENK
jgi:sugar phosphate permease